MSGGGKYIWEAEDKKKGMSSSELEAAILNAKSMFGSTTILKVSARVGFKNQIQEIRFEPNEELEAFTSANPARTPPQIRPA